MTRLRTARSPVRAGRRRGPLRDLDRTCPAIVPFPNSAPKTADLLENATLKVYRGRPHGLTGAYEQEFNADLHRPVRACGH
jgi:hypothetical protein